ncbi:MULTISPECIES: DUF4097 family beta strand repeat-containing protein [unclassified Mycobacterium]|uniref:DUF4097 family beta strand repeat-containing protein n=1 Tax=unclassified Mycobacterium TaxID=2642494 RepID=UPI000491A444|nr:MULTISPECIES: DUF4097 family beta strand repeat-containing protein [unclassified Mycobacterium]SDZ94130.1 Putative adhesin [Mycobacterium sp. 283mftsu]
MRTFPTPGPITATIELGAGAVRVTAADRPDTEVRVTPRDPLRAADVRAAEQAHIDFANDTLTVTVGKKLLSLSRGAVTVDIALPSLSRLAVAVSSADLRVDGTVGDCRFDAASGNATLDAVEGNIKAATASGDLAVRRVLGNANASTASGELSIDGLDGGLKFQAASGSATVGTLRGSVHSRTASGSLTVAAAESGSISAATASGDVEVGVAQGTAANLDLDSRSGTVRSDLTPAAGPENDDRRLTVHARTASGDITIRRATTVPA